MQQPVNKYIVGALPPSEQIYTALFKFIDMALNRFCPLSKKNDGNVVDAEDDITEDLADFFDSEQENMRGFFKFCNQSKHSDIGVKYGRKYEEQNRSLICWIEAKRLPTPESSNRDPREYVYVDKNKYHGGGGIQRFKMNLHGKNLPYAIMIGYIQKYDCLFWYNTINNYISGLTKSDLSGLWDENEFLEKTETKKCNRFISKHHRLNKGKEFIQDIVIRHYWINLNPANKVNSI